jgi:hypothetical protein
LDLKPSQFYNHHPSNREITTKAGLCKNLWQTCFDEHELKVSEFFPRCYDLADLKQLADFEKDFNQTLYISILIILAKQFTADPKVISLYEEYSAKLVTFA